MLSYSCVLRYCFLNTKTHSGLHETKVTGYAESPVRSLGRRRWQRDDMRDPIRRNQRHGRRCRPGPVRIDVVGVSVEKDARC